MSGNEPADLNQSSTVQQSSDAVDLDSLKHDVSQVTDAAVERGHSLLRSASEQATGFLDGRKNDAANSVAEAAKMLRTSAQQAFGDRSAINAIVNTAVGRVERFSDTLRDRSAAEIVHDVEAALRRRPTTVAVITIALGFLGARFVRASAGGLRNQPEREYPQHGRASGEVHVQGVGPAAKAGTPAHAGSIASPGLST
jgi:hypothetical protein